MTLIGQKGCRNCAHHRQDGKQLFCGLYPPSVFPMMGQPGPKGPSVGWLSTQPPVSPEMYCSQHSYVKAYDQFDESVKQAVALTEG